MDYKVTVKFVYNSILPLCEIITAQYCDKKEVEKLINCGADPNAEDFDGYTPLFYAGTHCLVNYTKCPLIMHPL